MKNKSINAVWYILLLCTTAVFVLLSCQKTEFMPELVGEEVPYKNEASQDVTQLLTTHNEAKVFLAAWQKSNIVALSKAAGVNTKVTVLAPTDNALKQVGITLETIQKMTTEEAADFVQFYSFLGDLNQIKLGKYSLMVRSMLKNQNYRVPFYDNTEPVGRRYDIYAYRHYLAVKDGDLLVNGKSKGKLAYEPATNGGIYMLEKVIEKPTMTILEALIADGRFTFFVESQRLSEEMFYEKMLDDIEPLWGYRMSKEEFLSYYPEARVSYQRGWDIDKDPFYNELPNLNLTATFAPTDDAFRKAGFNSVADILAFNAKRGDVRYDDLYFEPRGSYPTDTLFSFHRNWGRVFATEDPAYGIAMSNNTVFYSNDLDPALLNDYYVNIGGSSQVQYAYKMPLAFSKNGNQIQMKIKETEQAPINIIETDINTVNGPIHVVDNLLLPKGFKLK
ncbi:hypothetical protein ACR79Q_07050 [Sphingobacterium multivorum]|uniref:hypothetical protein n=1 Tax=Sphingobacterium multivorum TaxID=28454 RepID=UPI003DA54321